MFAYLSQSADDDGGFAIVTDRFLCLLGNSATAAQASELYVALDSESVHLNSALSAMIAHYSLTDFAIVEVLDAVERRMTVAVQGDVVADVDGATGTRLSGPTGATWVMGEVKGVSALSLSLAESSGAVDDERLPLRRGVVRAAAVALDPAIDQAPALAFIDEPSPKTVQMNLPRDPSVISQKYDAALSDNGQHGVVSRVARAKPARVVQEPSPPAPSADKGAVRIDLSAEAAGGRLGVQLSEGHPFAANVPLVFGRRPWSTELDTSSIVSISLESPMREISAIHLEIAEVGGRLQARDLNSTNGTVIMTPGRPAWLLDHGRDTILKLGDVLDLGEGALVRIVGLDDSVYHR